MTTPLLNTPAVPNTPAEVPKEQKIPPPSTTLDKKGAKSCDQTPLEHAVMELIATPDFDGYLLTQFDCKIVEEIVGTDIQTAALVYSEGRFFIRLVEKFFKSLTDDGRVAVLKHEVAHFVMKHFARRNGRDPMLFNIACLPPTECVQTSTGLVQIDAIQKEDKVYGSLGTTELVTRIMSRAYKGKLYTIKGVGTIPLTVTNEHPLLVASRKKVASSTLLPPAWKKAKDLQERKNYLLIPTPEKSFNERTLDLKEFFLEHSRPSNIAKGIKDKKLALTKELAWILGMYVAEGSRINNKDFGLAFSLHEDEKVLCARIMEYFTTLEYTPRKTACKGKGVIAQISSTILGKAFSKWCGRGATNKRIPHFILHNTRIEIVESFLDGYYAGDGCQTKPYQRVATTVSKQLAIQLQLLITRLGLFAPIGIIPARSRILYEKNIKGRTQYTVTWAVPQITNRTLNGKKIECNSCRWKKVGNYFAVPITKIDVEQYEGDVYNISTENHTFLINNVVSHNCDMAINQMIPHMPPEAIKLPARWSSNESSEYYYDYIQKKVNENERRSEPGGSKPGGKLQLPEQFDSVMDAPDSEVNDSGSIADEIIKEQIKAQLDNGMSSEKMRGLHAGALSEYIDELTRPPMIDWKHALARFASSLVDQHSRITLKRPDRRELAPWGKKKEYLPRMIICIDTSGSVSDDMLKTFFSQINLLGRTLSEIAVVIADAQVHEHFIYRRGMEEKLRSSGYGRGGTDFDPAIVYINEKLRDFDGAIYLTDGWCPKPDTRCVVPMLWVVTKNDDFPGKPRIMAKEWTSKRR